MMTGFEQYTKKTKRALFLEEMEQVVPWGELCALLKPHYPKAGNGRAPIGVERMLRCLDARVGNSTIKESHFSCLIPIFVHGRSKRKRAGDPDLIHVMSGRTDWRPVAALFPFHCRDERNANGQSGADRRAARTPTGSDSGG